MTDHLASMFGTAVGMLPTSPARSLEMFTEITEYEGPHLLPSKEGWQEVADYALTWALEHASAPAGGADPA